MGDAGDGPANSLRARFNAGLFLGTAIIVAIVLSLATYAAVRALQPGWGEAAVKIAPVAQRKSLSLAMPTLDGRNWSLADHAGHVVVLNYFATWCPPCRAEIPDLRAIATSYGAKGVDMAAISVDADSPGRTRTALKDFNDDEHLPFPILLPAAETLLLLDESVVPQTFVIDRQGRIAAHLVGQTDRRTLGRVLDAVLAEEESSSR